MAGITRQKNKHPLRNLMGLEVRRLREERGWSQSDLARRLQIAGWDIERTVLTKIELRRRCLCDYELALLAKTLGVNLGQLVPRQAGLSVFFERKSKL